MSAALLDVNVLIALLDPDHEFHDAAHDWFLLNRSSGWATCPLTENACLRILGKAGYPQAGFTVARVREVLTEFSETDGHLFWPDSVSILDPARFETAVAGPKNITDIYLLDWRRRTVGRLATFDRNIPCRAVAGGSPDDLDILPDSFRPM